MKILIGSDHELLTSGLIQLLKDIQSIEYMVLVSDVEEFIQSIRKYDFDLVIIDVDIQGAGGLRSILSSLETIPKNSKKVLLYKEPDKGLENLFFNEHIDGLFYDKASLEELMDFFQKVLAGKRSYIKSGQVYEEKDIDELSKREEEVFLMKVRGYSVKETAKLLNISPKTVENHRRNIRKKLNITKSSEWYKWGKKLGAI